MCIIIHRAANAALPKDLYETCALAHRDGMGVSWIENDELKTVKGLYKIEEFYKIIQPLEHLELLIHFRAASTGTPVTKEMCHPFEINSGNTFMTEDGKPRFYFSIVHNGRIDWQPYVGTSDTYSFVEDILKPHFEHNPFFLDLPAGITWLEESIAYKNKMVILRWDALLKQSKTYIINKIAGNEDKGCWFSNLSWKPTVKSAYHDDYWEQMYGDSEYRGDEFTSIDAQGWGWSYSRNMWWNVNTLIGRERLSHRPKRPDHMDKPKDEMAGLNFIFDVYMYHLDPKHRTEFYFMVRKFAKEAIGNTKPGVFKDDLQLFRFEVRHSFADEMDSTGQSIQDWNDQTLDNWVVDHLDMVKMIMEIDDAPVVSAE